MLRTRVIPCLLLKDDTLVKTVQFKNPKYIGDPANTVRIFNEIEVDELCFLDIRASVENRSPNIEFLKQIADECFMPLAYGGGITTHEQAMEILSIGFEKVVINTSAYQNPSLIGQIAEHAGSQSVIGSIDAKKGRWGKAYSIHYLDGTKSVKLNPAEYAKRLEDAGVGEILLTSINKEGTWQGYDLDLVKSVSEAVSVPVIANGGAGELNHLKQAAEAGASALSVGSMVVYQSQNMGVLVNFPDREELSKFIY